MIKIDEDLTTIHLTRGDVTTEMYNKLAFRATYVDLETEEEEEYEFQPNDKITFVVFEKKGYTKKELLRKNYTIKELGYIKPTKYPELPLSDVDTKQFPLSNKKQTYWYDLVLNDTATILGMDEDGAKKIIVYPEVGEE